MNHAGDGVKNGRAAWLRRVEDLCGERGVQLTALRRQVLGLLAGSAAPLTAYALLDELAKLQGRGVAPPTVYRTLDFLVRTASSSRSKVAMLSPSATRPATIITAFSSSAPAAAPPMKSTTMMSTPLC